jgi:hypothetical protein
MTIAEKLNIMEMIWDDLCRQSPPIESPDWHFDELKQREQALTDGTAKIMTWDEAEKQLRQKLL